MNFLPNVVADHDLDGVDQSEMLLKGRETKRPDLIYNIDLHEPAYFGHTAYRWVGSSARHEVLTG